MQVFIDNGIEDLETILELDDKHLEQVGIPLGHKLKVMKRIKDLRKDRGMSVPESRQGPRTEVAKETREHVQQELEALPEPSAKQLGQAGF